MLFLLVSLLASHLAWGQGGPISGTTVIDPLEGVTPPGPTSASLGKYGEMPVDNHTGNPQVNIPLYTVTDGKLTVPISLSYHTGGIRVEEIASWVGLGWNLNAGGVITRTVRGNPDEEIDRGFIDSPDIPDNFDNPDNCPYIIGLLDSKTYDSEPDQFHFNVNGMAGSFFFDQGGNIHLSNFENIKIEFINRDHFKLTTPQGIQYYFGLPDKHGNSTKETSLRTFYCEGPSGVGPGNEFQTYVTAWYLTKIEDENNNDLIEFTYVNNALHYKINTSETEYIFTDGTQGLCPSRAPGTCYNLIDLDVPRLTSIESAQSKVDFIHQSNRLDLDDGIRLSEIRIFGANKTTRLKKYLFNHGYFGPTSGGTFEDYRLQLKTVREVSSGVPVAQPYTFTYHNPNTIPSRDSKNQDHWGFYNGAGNQTLIPFHTFGTQSVGGANREPNLDFARIGSLSKITYPTGGHKEFEYELHSYSNFAPVTTTIENRVFRSESLEINGAPYNNTTPIYILENGTEVQFTAYFVGEGEFLDHYAKILDANNNVIHSFLPSNDGATQLVIDINLDAGDYYLETSVLNNTEDGVDMVATLTARWQEEVPLADPICEKPAGGLRIARITDHDGISTDNDLIREFNYNYLSEDSLICDSISSGYLSYPIAYVSENVIGIPGPQGAQCSQKIICTYNAYSSSSNSALLYKGGSPVGYRQVEVKVSGNGRSIFKYSVFSDYANFYPPFPPVISRSHRKGLLLEQIDENEAGQVIRTIENDYDIRVLASVTGLSAAYRYKVLDNCVLTGCMDFYYDYYDLTSESVLLTQTTETIDDVIKTTNYEYDSQDRHIFPTAVEYENSDGTQYRQETSYAFEKNYNSLISRNMVGIPLEVVNLEGSSITGGQSTEYGLFGVEIYPDVLNQVMSVSGNVVLERPIYNMLSYNADGKPTAFKRVDDQIQSLIWGHQNEVLTATVRNAEQNEVAFTSFEASTAKGGWVYDNSNAIKSTEAWGGNRYFRMSSNIGKFDLAPGDYVLGFWAKGNGVFSAAGQSATVTNDWSYYELELDNLNGILYLVGNSNIYLDELRIHPKDALMSTYTYDEVSLLQLAVGDESGMLTHYQYDEFQRLQLILDNNKDVVKSIEYEYHSGDAINHIKTQNVLVSGAKNLTAVNALLTSQANRNFQYLDGLGRPIQSVQVEQSPAGNDIIVPQVYDPVGREHITYLHYTAPTNGGAFRSDAITEQSTARGPYAYNQVEFEASPLNRPSIQWGAGEDWRTAVRNNSTVYRSNNANEVRNIATPGGSFYPANKLYVTEVTNENNQVTRTYTDMRGLIVMVDESGDQTYTLYDGAGNITGVIPPLGVERMENSNNNWNINSAAYDPYVYRYTYDMMQRMTSKHIPGAGQTLFLYDRLDREVMSIDANGTKLCTKYDILGRPIITGEYIGTDTPDNNDGLFENITTGSFGYTTNQSFPSANVYIHTVNYYDDYDINRNGIVETDEDYHITFNGIPYPSSNYPYVRGKQVASRTGVLPADANLPPNQWLITQTYFDELGREIQIREDHPFQDEDVTFMKYDFAGRLTNSLRRHFAKFQNNTITRGELIAKEYTYDPAGRLLNTSIETYNGHNVLLSTQEYNEENLLEKKSLHNTSGSNYLQHLDYTYNIRDWLTGVNTFDCTNDNDLFSMSLTYISSPIGGPVNYNGNITTWTWKVGCRDRQRYRYRYDDRNRLLLAAYDELDASGASINAGHYTTSGITYDKNGNILTLRRFGPVNTANTNFDLIDRLIYRYDGNRLSKIRDQDFARNRGFQASVTNFRNYGYDNKGNMIRDDHKEMDVAYNHLNLPYQITFDNGNWIRFTYDALGRKWQKETSDNSIKRYINGIEYDGDCWEAIYHEEGRLTPLSEPCSIYVTTWQYEYTIKDHLGNARVSFTDLNGDGTVTEAEIIQENNYYAFGMAMDGNWNATVGTENQYQYNGKELNEDFGLNWSDYGARWYDAAIGRFTGVDPIAEEFAHLSVYNYADNSPISNIDLHGLQALFAADGKLIGYSVQEGQGPTQIAQDLNENYSCELSCAADWLQIVYDNAEQFQNVFDGEGKVDDKYNGDYKKGNIQPGDILVITNGQDVEPESTTNPSTPLVDQLVDSLENLLQGKRRQIEGIIGLRDMGPDLNDNMNPLVWEYAHGKIIQMLTDDSMRLHNQKYELIYKGDSSESTVNPNKNFKD